MDVLESRIPRPNQPDHGLYVWPQNMYIEQHLELFRKAQASLPLGALVRGVINHEAAESFMGSGLHEGVEGLPVIPGRHIPTALRIFEHREYRDNHSVLLARGVRGLTTTWQLRRHFSSEQIDAARDIAQKVDPLTPIMTWVNAGGYIATRGSDGTLAIATSPYSREKDKQKYNLNSEYARLRWTERCEFVMDNRITHVANRYPKYIDTESYPLPLLTPPPGYDSQHVVQELGWLKNGVFEPAIYPGGHSS